MEVALVALLIASGSPVNLIAGTRVEWSRSAQGTGFPRAVLSRVDGIPTTSDEGVSGLVESRVQVDCLAETYAGASALADAFETMLSGVSMTAGGVQFQSVTLESRRDLGIADANASERPHRISLDFLIWHST